MTQQQQQSLPRRTPTPCTSPRRLFWIALAGEGRGPRLTAATVLLTIHAVCEAAIPVLIGVTIDRAVVPADPVALSLWLGALLGVFAVLTTSYQVASRLMVTVYGGGEQSLRRLVLGRLLRPALSQRTLTPGEALTFVNSDTYRVAGVAWSVAQQCSTIAAVVAAALAMLVISPLATAVVFAATVVMMLVMRMVSRPLERRGLAEQEAATEAGAVAADFMAGFRVLVGIGARGEAARRYRAASDASRIAASSAGRSLAGYEAVSAALAAVVTTALTRLSAWFAAEGRIGVGELVTVLGLTQFVSGYLAYAGSFPSNWIHKYASARRIAEVVNAPDLLDEPGEGEPVPVASGIALSFRADGSGSRNVEVRDGELLGVRPPDSTSARDLSRRLGLRTRVSRGTVSVRIDGQHRDVRDLDPVDYRRRVTSMPHRQAIASGTLLDAVRGVGTTDRARPEWVHVAALEDAIGRIGGWDAQVGEAGRRLSGGQRQRIGLARALHSDADVLVLDEPTSAVDAVTEAHIAQALAAHHGTTIVITTSPVLLAACDRVIALPSEEGTSSHG